MLAGFFIVHYQLLLLFYSNACLLFIRYCVVVGLSKLRNLQSLNVACTEFNSHGLDIVIEDLPHLEVLNISGTQVSDISSLRKCRDRLKSLYMYNLKVCPN